MTVKTTFLFILLAFSTMVLGQAVDSIDNTFTNPTTLTDQQMDNAKNFTHQGVKDRIYNEGCESIDKCKDEEGFPLESLIGKAYAVFGMVSGGGIIPKMNAPVAKGATPAASETGSAAPATGGKAAEAPKGEEKTDFCMIGAMANEALGGLMQSTLQKEADSTAQNPGDAQMNALMSLRQTHEARAKTATFQAGVYTAVTACYGVMIATGKAATDWKTMVKLAGAGALSALYWKKVSKHKDAVKKIEKVIDSMELAGKNCNPWTTTPCFCSEMTSRDLYPAEYQEVCILNNGNPETPKIALGCASVVGNKMAYDKECKCKATNSCMKSGLKAYNPKFNGGANLMNDVNSAFDVLSSGEIDEGELRQATLNTSSMIARMKPKVKAPKVNLTDEQKKMAQALAPYMPQAMAEVAAASNSNYRGGISDSASAAAISKLSPNLKKKLAEAIDVDYKKGSGNTGSVVEEEGTSFSMAPGAQGAGKTGTEVVSFAEQALSKADVSNTPETPIFDIISNRYRRSGWQKLDRFEK